MGFKWFEQGTVVPISPGTWSTQQRIEKLQHISKSRKVADSKENFSSPREELAAHAAQKAYQQSESMPHEREQAICASQIMTSPVVTLTPEAHLAEAWKLILDRRFRHIPILSQGKKLIGIISDRDLLREAAGIDNAVSNPANISQEQITIQSLIKRKVLTASPDTEIRQIARVLLEERIGAMPIVDDHGYLMGIITRSDILRTLINYAPLELWI